MEPEKPVVEEQPKPSTEEGSPIKQPTSTSPLPKKYWWIAVIVVLVVVGGLGVYAATRRKSDTPKQDPSVANDARIRNENSQNGQSDTQTNTNDQNQNKEMTSESRFLAENGQTCVKRDVTFTSLSIPDDQLGFVEPMGKMLDGHVTPTDHVYVHPKNSRAADNTVDVVMPANGTVVAISAMPAEYIGDRNQQTAAEDHRLVIMHSCKYFSIFIHVHKLDPALSSVVGSMEPNTSKNVSIELKAGDKLGKIGGSAHDWTLVDTDTVLSGFTTPSLYDGESWKIHAIDPLSVYSGALKTKYDALSMRSTAPFGGKIDYDKKGALIGNWFKEGTGGYSGTNKDTGGRYWDGHLAIAPDYVDPATTEVSIGNWTGQAAQFAVKGSFDPSAVTVATGPVKYELTSVSYVLPSGSGWTGNEAFSKGITVSKNASTAGTIMFQVLEGEKLKVEKFVGKTPAQVTDFTEAAATYSR